MDQGAVVEPDDSRVWTPLRLVLIALAAIAGGLVLSIALGGPARADTPSSPPQPSLVGQLATGVTGLTKAALAPVDDVVASVAPRAVSVPAVPAPVAPVAAAAQAIPAALDTALAQTPVASTPLWQSVVGSRPVEQVVSPLGAVLRPLVPSVPPLLSPVLTVPIAAAPGAVVAATVPASVVGSTSAHLVRVPAASAPAPVGAAPGTLRHVDSPNPGPVLPLGAPDEALSSATSGGSLAPAVLVAFGAALLLAAASARRRGWTLPAAPVFRTDVSPD